MLKIYEENQNKDKEITVLKVIWDRLTIVIENNDHKIQKSKKGTVRSYTTEKDTRTRTKWNGETKIGLIQQINAIT